MTYQAKLLHDKHANIALDLPSKYGLQGAELHACAVWLQSFESERAARGKATTDDHLTQEAVAWAKRLRRAGSLTQMNVAHYQSEMERVP